MAGWSPDSSEAFQGVFELDLSTNVLDFATHTTEGAPITKIFVNNFPPKTTESDIVECFKNFGQIKKYFIRWANSSPTKPLFAFITYSNSDEAFKARVGRVKIFRKYLRVLPADPWHQEWSSNPGRFVLLDIRKLVLLYMTYHNSTSIEEDEKCMEDAKKEGNDCIQSDEPNILDILNEDCFMKIFSYLSLPELMKTERVSICWRNFVQQKYRSVTEFSAIPYHSKYSINVYDIWGLHRILSKIGIHLKKLYLTTISGLNTRIPCLISKFCPNITELYISKLNIRNWNVVLKRCQDLKKLSFEDCTFINERTFAMNKTKLVELQIKNSLEPIGHILSILNIRTLKKLTIVKSAIPRIGFLGNLPCLENLQELNLEQSSAAEEFITALLQKVRNVVSLNLSSIMFSPNILTSVLDLHKLNTLKLAEATDINNEFLRELSRNCPNLIALDISVGHSFYYSDNLDAGLAQILSLKKIEYLNVACRDVTNKPFQSLGKNNIGVKLKKLICRHNLNITDAAICAVFKSCPEIEEVDVYKCPKIEAPNLFKNVLEIIHVNGCKPGRYNINFKLDVSSEIYPSCSCLVTTFEESSMTTDTPTFSDFEDDEYDGDDFLSYEDDDPDDLIDMIDEMFM